MQIEMVLAPSLLPFPAALFHPCTLARLFFPPLSSHVMAMGGRRMDRIADGESAFKPLSLQLDMFAFRRSEPVSISVEERYGTQSTRLP